MSDPIPIPGRSGDVTNESRDRSYFDMDQPGYSSSGDLKTPGLASGSTPGSPSIPGLSRSGSFSNMSAYEDGDDLESLPPLDRLTVFDFIENLALPQRLEKIQMGITKQTEKVRRQQQKVRDQSKQARQRMVDEWRKRVPDPEERLRKYRKAMRTSVDRLGSRWNDTRAITTREKISFIAGVLNIFISGYLVGAAPQYFHLWYTCQLAYFYPIRYYSYHKRGMHYFLADLCYYVNFMLVLMLWFFPNSKRLFISTFCLAFGNNAVAIAMWRNSLVFHSLDKVTSLFIHIMPCVTIHCVTHLVSDEYQQSRFPAIYAVKHASRNSSEHFGLISMVLWSSIPYAVWQLSYHFLITIRRREQIAAGRPTSFTWLRRSYSKTWIGKFVLSLPDALQEPAFMGIQYSYALATMIPAPLWLWYRWASAGFLTIVFVWSIYNGASYYIDVFGQRFQKELDQLKRDMAKWQMSPELGPRTPGFGMTPGLGHHRTPGAESGEYFSLGGAMMSDAPGSKTPGLEMSGKAPETVAVEASGKTSASTSGFQENGGDDGDLTGMTERKGQ